MTTNIIQGLLLVGIPERVHAYWSECGKNRGQQKVFSMAEMLGCQEIFGSSIVESLYQQESNLNKKEANQSRTKETPGHKANLNSDFSRSEPIKHKRL